jgi:hypothetical protein
VLFAVLASTKNAFCNDYQTFPVDGRISYPSYRSLDDLIDVERLRRLDEPVTATVRKYIEAEKGAYFRNLYRLSSDTPYEPGVREVWLSKTDESAPWQYLDMVDSTDLWQITDAAKDFPELMAFIETLPFARTGRMIIIYDDLGKAVPAHRDHLEPDVCNEFIWFRTNLNKPFYMFNPETGEKKYVESYSCWFDAVNQYHGTDACDELSVSIRVDGIFTDEFRRQIPRPEFNAASTPALWAALEEQAI